MFDLEQHISDWRRQMLAAGIKLPVPLEELEIHLREEIEQQMKSGLDEQQALQTAIQRIGQPQVLKSEFQRARALPKHAAKYISAVSGILLVHGLRCLFQLSTVHPPMVVALWTIWCLRIVFLLTITTAILFFSRPRTYWIAALFIVGFYVIVTTVALIVCYPSTTIAVKLTATVPPFALSLITMFCLLRARSLDLVATRNIALEPTATAP